MELAASLCLAVALCFMALQLFWAYRFARSYPPETGGATEERLPRATILLCLRGADPSLADCLQGLFQQDYPDYEIRIIIDSADDPAWETVSALLAGRAQPAVRVSVLRHPQATCSLKLSALVQAIRELDESTEIVALIDADVIPGRRWLRHLVQPFADPQVGATSGFRWYMPRGHSSWGTHVRALWNAVACTQMVALHIPWAGSMAFRAELFRRSDLLERWARSFVEDAGSHRVLRSLGLQLRYVPAVTIVNHETIGLKHAFQFIRRQLLNARLYHESWPVIVGVSLGTPLALLGVGVTALVVGAWPWLAVLGGALAVYVLGMAVALSWVDRQINRLAQMRGAAPYAYSWRVLLAVPLTQAVYLSALLSASVLRKVEWRGVVYEIDGSGSVHLTAYHPYRSTALPQPDASLV